MCRKTTCTDRRTGRAGNEGEALSLVGRERDYLRDIERVRTANTKVVIPGFEPDPAIKAEPITLDAAVSAAGEKRRWSGRRPHVMVQNVGGETGVVARVMAER